MLDVGPASTTLVDRADTSSMIAAWMAASAGLVAVVRRIRAAAPR